MSNFLRSYEKEMAKYTDAPEVFHSAVAVSILGSALTRHRYRCLLSGGTPARWTNLWTFLVGDSAESRKSTCVNMGIEVLSRAMPELRLPDDGSPEGFAKAFVKKEQLEAGDAAGILMSDELGLFLMSLQKDYMRSMKGMMMSFYDVPGVYQRDLSRESFTVTSPRFSMLGGVALELLPVLTSADDWLGGFMNRALIIFASRSRTMPRAGTVPERTYESLARELMHNVGAWRTTRLAEQRRVKKSATATGIRRFLYDFNEEGLAEMSLVRGSMTKSIDDNVRLLRGRADVHLLKLAAIEQIAMDPEMPYISKKAVRAAAPLFQHWWDHAPAVMEMAFARGNSDTEGDRLPRRVLRLVRNKGDKGYPELELMKATVLDWELFQRALRSLESAGMVERVQPEDGSPVVIKLRK